MTLGSFFGTIGTAVAMTLLATSCATSPAPPPPPSERLLTDAGFKTVVATTEQQKQHLQVLQQGIVSQVQQTGKHYFVYPDTANSRLYVGTPKEYQAYLALRTKAGLPNPAPTDATTADMRSYLKQDAAMQKADAFDAQIPPWAVWPDFANLGWIP